jgi:hypothetical protein
MHHCAMSLPLMVGASVLSGRPALAWGISLSGLVVLANVAMWIRVCSVMMHSAVEGRGAFIAANSLISKQLGLLFVVVMLARAVGPEPVLFAFTVPLWGALLLAVASSTQRADVQAALGATPLSMQESGC